MNRPAPATILLLLLVLTPVLPPPTVSTGQATGPGDADGVEAPWWQESAPFRIPVTVTAEVRSPLTGHAVPQGGHDLPVRIDLDLAGALDSRGLLDGLNESLDTSSLRVVETVPHGDAEQRSGSPTQRPVPARFEPHQDPEITGPGTPPPDKAADLKGTLTWLMPGPTGPGETRYFWVYIDVSDDDPAPPRADDRRLQARLASLDWKDAGHMHHAMLALGEESRILVAGTQPDTRVQITTQATGRTWFTTAREVQPGQFLVAAPPATGDVTTNTSATIQASKPVVAALVTGPGDPTSADPPTFYVPSTDGGLLGQRFFLSLHDHGLPPEHVFAIATGDTAEVTVHARTGTVAGTREVPAGNAVDLADLVDTSRQRSGSMQAQRIDSTAPILLQAVGVRSTHQLAGTLGQPLAQALVGVAEPEASYYATGTGTATVRAFGTIDPDILDRVEVQDGAANATRSYTDPPRISRVDATTPVSILVSDREGPEDDEPTGAVAVVGGDHARTFSFHVRPTPRCACPGAVAYAFHDDTTVHVTDTVEDAFGHPHPRTRTVLLDAGEPLALSHLGPVELHAEKPLTVQVNDDPRFEDPFPRHPPVYEPLAGHRLSPQARIGGLQVAGCLPGIQAPDGDPIGSLTLDMAGGTSQAVPIELENRAHPGHRDGPGNLTATAEIPQDARARGWTVDLELGPPGLRAVRNATHHVHAPPEPGPAVVPVRIDAWCSGGLDVTDTAQLLVVPRSGGPLALVGPDGNDPRVPVQVNGTGQISFELVSRSEHTHRVGLLLQAEQSLPAWTLRVQPANLTLEPGDRANVLVEAKAPGHASVLPSRLVAFDLEDPDVTDEAEVLWVAREGTTPTLSLTPSQRLTAPGTNATYNLTLRNPGEDPAVLWWTVHGSLGEGWDRRLSQQGPATLAPGQTRTVPMAVHVPTDASSGEQGLTRVRLWQENSTGPDVVVDEAVATTLAAPVTDLNVTLLDAHVDEDHRPVVRALLRQDGNHPQRVTAHVRAPEAPWSFAPQGPTAQGEVTLELGVDVIETWRADAVPLPAGAYRIEVLVQAATGEHQARAGGTLQVPESSEPVLEALDAPARVDHAGQATLPLRFGQNGTVHGIANLSVASPWRILNPPGPVPLAPGEHRVVQLQLRWDGDPTTSATPPIDVALDLAGSVARTQVAAVRSAPDLAFSQARWETDPDGGSRLVATLSNEGGAVAEPIVLEAFLDGQPIRGIGGIDRLPPETRREVTILLPRSLAEDARSARLAAHVVNASGPGVQAEITVHPEPVQAPIPGVPLLLFFGGLAALARATDHR